MPDSDEKRRRAVSPGTASQQPRAKHARKDGSPDANDGTAKERLLYNLIQDMLRAIEDARSILSTCYEHHCALNKVAFPNSEMQDMYNAASIKSLHELLNKMTPHFTKMQESARDIRLKTPMATPDIKYLCKPTVLDDGSWKLTVVNDSENARLYALIVNDGEDDLERTVHEVRANQTVEIWVDKIFVKYKGSRKCVELHEYRRQENTAGPGEANVPVLCESASIRTSDVFKNIYTVLHPNSAN